MKLELITKIKKVKKDQESGKLWDFVFQLFYIKKILTQTMLLEYFLSEPLQNPRKTKEAMWRKFIVKLASDFLTSWPSMAKRWRTNSSSTCILEADKENDLVLTHMKPVNTICMKKSVSFSGGSTSSRFHILNHEDLQSMTDVNVLAITKERMNEWKGPELTGDNL